MRRVLRRVGQDLDDVAVLQNVLQRHDLAVGLGSGDVLTDLGVIEILPGAADVTLIFDIGQFMNAVETTADPAFGCSQNPATSRGQRSDFTGASFCRWPARYSWPSTLVSKNTSQPFSRPPATIGPRPNITNVKIVCAE